MCGIIGTFSSDGVNIGSMQSAMQRMGHRGPDAAQHYLSTDQRVFLGHLRLSIIDVSDAANQPMYSQDGRYVIVYNGEVYNFETLKEKLPQFNWRTHSDTEVVLELFAQFGAASFAWLNGIFAFAIYDIQDEQIWICRDQLGIKPLFIQRDGKKLIFASELKAVIAANQEEGKNTHFHINRKAVAEYLHLGYIPEPLTIYRGIKKFPAGNYAVLNIKKREWNRFRYWKASDYYLQHSQQDEAQLFKQYKEKLFAAVERQLLSDVPLGTFLSGGIDSSLVTAVATKISNKKVSTFSIGFEDAQFDESMYAAQVAQHLQTTHHQFRVHFDDVLALVPNFLNVYDEPFADSSAFPTMLVSKLARQHVTVALSGDGGDELFQGYGMYAWAKRLSETKNQLLHKPIFWASKLMDERHQRAGRVFNYPAASRKRSHIFSQEQYLFSEQELKRLLIKNDFDFSALNQTTKKGSPEERQAFWDVEHYLKDDLLVKVDRASMQYSLETRVPLLDKDLLEFSLGLPLSAKVHPDYGTKYFMKKALYEMVPQSIFERPKHGFSIPMNKWLSKELKPLLDQYMSKQKVEYAGFVEYKVYKKMLDQYLAGKTYLYNRIWALLVLHWWYFEKK